MSRESLPIVEWTHIAVVYGLRELALYINGHLQGNEMLAPTHSAEMINAVVPGGTCAFPFTPEDFFTGGIRRVRIYGRNLSLNGFLQVE